MHCSKALAAAAAFLLACPMVAAQVPTNCTAEGDVWTRERFSCSIDIPPVYNASCAVGGPPGSVQCNVVNTEKLSIQSGVTCPVQDCTAVCDTVVLQNFFPPDLVFSVAQLLAAWKPSVPGC